jgi:hypothetical protein
MKPRVRRSAVALLGLCSPFLAWPGSDIALWPVAVPARPHLLPELLHQQQRRRVDRALARRHLARGHGGVPPFEQTRRRKPALQLPAAADRGQLLLAPSGTLCLLTTVNADNHGHRRQTTLLTPCSTCCRRAYWSRRQTILVKGNQACLAVSRLQADIEHAPDRAAVKGQIQV